MKKCFIYALYTALLVAALAFTSCQQDPDDQISVDEQETLMASSATVQLMEKTVSNDGSYDNIVDGSSCFDIRFPYTVAINGDEINIKSREDLHLIEEIFDAIDGDDDILDILFPVSVTLADYSEVTLNGIDDLRQLAEACQEGGSDDDIECIDFVYPIKLFTFDVNAQQTGSVVVESDKDLRRFFAGLNGTDLVSIDFPLALAMYDGTEIQVGTNAELADAIERAKNACDEDDDNDYNDDDFTKERLDALLVACPWSIHDLERDGIIQTEQYRGYLLKFNEDGTVKLVNAAGSSLTGTWSTRVADWKVLVKMDFELSVDFNLEWSVYEIEKNKIKFYTANGNRIIMNSICDVIDQDPMTLRNILSECSWIIKQVKVGGDEIRRLLGYEFEFKAGGVVTLSNGDIASQGTWEITTNSQGRLVMAIVMGDEPGVTFEWPLSELRNDRLKFEIPGTAYELILQRVCNDNSSDGDVLEIRNILMGGAWMVAKYSEDGADETQNYMGYDFSFGALHKITVSQNQDPLQYGLWRVIRNSDNKLKVYLNLGDQDPFGSLTDDWELVSITANRIEMKNVSGGTGGISILVFEK